MTKSVIKNGIVIFPDKNKQEKVDIHIADGKIVYIGNDIADKGARVIDASGCYILPGMVDMHVHLRDPGHEYKEDISSGTKAAAAGGFSTIACMPNTTPVIDSPEMINNLNEKIKHEALINVLPIGAITKGLQGENLAEMGLMKEKGAITFSDDGKYIHDSNIMKNALLYAKALDVNLIAHCEDMNLSSDGDMNEGYYSTILGLNGIPAVSEYIAVARDVLLAEKYGPVHIAHISTKGSVEIIKEAKKRGVPVTCETAPHYFWFSEEDLLGCDTNFKMNPPLRSAEDRAAIIEGLKDGTIDVIATDHAPHSVDEKNCEFSRANFGILGLETAVGATITKLYHEEKMSLINIVKKLTVNPSKILKIDKGILDIGKDADLTIINVEKEKTIDSDTFFSKSKNSPFVDKKLKGVVEYTIVSGENVFTNKK
jgi:dihydroorotase